LIDHHSLSVLPSRFVVVSLCFPFSLPIGPDFFFAHSMSHASWYSQPRFGRQSGFRSFSRSPSPFSRSCSRSPSTLFPPLPLSFLSLYMYTYIHIYIHTLALSLFFSHSLFTFPSLHLNFRACSLLVSLLLSLVFSFSLSGSFLILSHRQRGYKSEIPEFKNLPGNLLVIKKLQTRIPIVIGVIGVRNDTVTKNVVVRYSRGTVRGPMRLRLGKRPRGYRRPRVHRRG